MIVRVDNDAVQEGYGNKITIRERERSSVENKNTSLSLFVIILL